MSYDAADSRHDEILETDWLLTFPFDAGLDRYSQILMIIEIYLIINYSICVSLFFFDIS
jgi:hypothetical protein